jgi:hypothetical protein
MLNPQFLAASICALGLASKTARHSVQTPQRIADRFDSFDPDGEAILTLPTQAARARTSRDPGTK